MRPSDVATCVQLTAADPLVGGRYGASLAHLKAAWLSLIGSDGSGTAAVFEEHLPLGRVTMVGAGVSAFVSDDFIRDLKTPPYFWIGPEIVRRIERGDSPILSSKQVRDANSGRGLNLVVWKSCIPVEHVTGTDFWDVLMTAFREYHRGYILKELIGQGDSSEHLLGMRNSGGLLWDGHEGRHREFWEDGLDEILKKPHVVGLTRELAHNQSGSWVAALFTYHPPRFGFSRSEQRLLLSALGGGTDQELSNELGISVDTVKKAWRSIYDRVAACSPRLIPTHLSADDSAPERGREKKQRLIAYLRDHPEELRPVSRKLLQQQASYVSR